MTSLTQQTFWIAARAMFERMARAVGEAAALADRAWIGPKEQSELRSWINPLIAVVRKLVLIEAIAIAKCALLNRASSDAHCQRHANAGLTKLRRSEASASPMRETRGPRPPSLRVWPQTKRTGPRVRQLGPPVLVRDIWRNNARAAAAHHLKKVRFMRPPPGVQLARRIEALTRILDRPLAAARRLARKLRAFPKLALKLIARKLPRTRRYLEAEYSHIGERAFDETFAWLHPNTS
jgi:hypothetical protein